MTVLGLGNESNGNDKSKDEGNDKGKGEMRGFFPLRLRSGSE
jgi:hypothetical protein